MIVRREADTGLEYIHNGLALRIESVHHLAALGHDWRLHQVAQQREDWMESLELPLFPANLNEERLATNRRDCLRLT